MKILGLIPARGGSKGVPRKNIKSLYGKPLIQYAIESALQSEWLSEVMVSTDDFEIAEIAEKLGVEVPFLRPKHLADDKSPTIDTLIHVLHEYELIGKQFDAVCLLQVTNPLRTTKMINDCIEEFNKNKSDSLISVREVPHQFNPCWTFMECDESHHLKISTGQNTIISRRQDLPKAYFRDGTIYITKSNIIKEQNSLYGNKIGFYVFKDEPYVNIDTLNDWKEAELLIQHLNK